MGTVDLNKIEDLSSWYTNGEGFIDFDGVLQLLRYRSIKPYFHGTSCLEIAPAQGITTAKLKDDFAHLDLVDGSQKLLDVIPDYPNMRKFHSMIENFTPDMQYDTIIMDHLLEHLEFPIPALERIKTWLKPDGILIVGVPNGKSFHRMLGVEMGMLDSIYTFNQRDIDLGHFRIYNLDTLQEDARTAGLKVLNTEGVFFKILSNKQLGEFSQETVEGFYNLGKQFKEHCAEIYVICGK